MSSRAVRCCLVFLLTWLPYCPIFAVEIPARTTAASVAPKTQVPYATLPVDLHSVSLTEISAVLREEVLKTLPGQLVAAGQHNWGHQAHVYSVQTVKVIQVLRNHGNWEKATAVAADLPNNLRLRTHSLSSPCQDRVAFAVRLDLPATVQVEKQIWQNGIEVFSCHGRARVRIRAAIQLECDTMPNAAASKEGVRYKMNDVMVWCDQFVVEKLSGIGGDVARASGGVLLHAYKPCEQAITEALQKTVADALLNAGESASVRAGLRQLLTASMAARTEIVQALAKAPSIDDALDAASQPVVVDYGPQVASAACNRTATAGCISPILLVEFYARSHPRREAPAVRPVRTEYRAIDYHGPVFHESAPAETHSHASAPTHETHEEHHEHK